MVQLSAELRLTDYASKSQRIYLPGMQFWFDDILYLGAPHGELGRIDAILRAMQIAVWKGQERSVPSPAQLSALFANYNRLAQRYGLDSCIVSTSFPS